jgi:hypothetical protein
MLLPSMTACIDSDKLRAHLRGTACCDSALQLATLLLQQNLPTACKATAAAD